VIPTGLIAPFTGSLKLNIILQLQHILSTRLDKGRHEWHLTQTVLSFYCFAAVLHASAVCASLMLQLVDCSIKLNFIDTRIQYFIPFITKYSHLPQFRLGVYCKKDKYRGRLSFKTQLKIEYSLPFTSSRKVLVNIPELNTLICPISLINARIFHICIFKYIFGHLFLDKIIWRISRWRWC
jgi:hypothetical protein